jgi:hypothetical protein
MKYSFGARWQCEDADIGGDDGAQIRENEKTALACWREPWDRNRIIPEHVELFKPTDRRYPISTLCYSYDYVESESNGENDGRDQHKVTSNGESFPVL